MSTVSALATTSLYRLYPMNLGNTGASTRMSGSTGTSAQNSTDSTQDTSDNSDDTDSDTDSTDSSSSTSSGGTAPSSQASADYRQLAKDLQADNTTAVQTDELKLQTDMADTQLHHSGSNSSAHHHKLATASAFPTESAKPSATLAAAGSTLNVTV